MGTGSVSAAIFAARIDACAAFQLGPRAEGARLAAIRIHACGGLFGGIVHTSVVAGLDTLLPPPNSPWVSAALRADARARVALDVEVRAGALARRALALLTRTDVGGDPLGRHRGGHLARWPRWGSRSDSGPIFVFR